MIEIRHNCNLLAILIPKEYEKEGINFLTPKENPLQVGILNYKKAKAIKPHYHKNMLRTIKKTQEFLYLIKGKIEVQLFYKRRVVKKLLLQKGDAIILISGGHAFKIYPNTKIIEVKQGPYIDSANDKWHLRLK